jgi:hypothetical protein
MSIIKTKRNLVAAYEPQTGDVAVLLRFGAMRVLEAIGDYEAVMRDAVAMADDMEAHIEVVPVNTDEMLKHMGHASLEDFIASLPPQERAQLRRECIANLQEVILKEKDLDVVREASAILAKLVNGTH